MAAEPLLLYTLALHLLYLLSLTHSSCDTADRELLIQAFISVANFQPPPPLCPPPPIHELNLHSRNLTGPVAWMLLRNISTLHTLDLSGNSISGSIPTGFWSAPALSDVNLAHNRLGGTLRFIPRRPISPLRSLNLSGNRFTNVVGISGLAGLQVLDFSRNALGSVPPGLAPLHALKYLDLSHNAMAGALLAPALPPPAGLRFFNVSCNNLTGRMDSKYLSKFGGSAFIRSGMDHHNTTTAHAAEHRRRKSRARAVKAGVVVGSAGALVAAVLAAVLGWFLFVRRRKGRMGGKEEEGVVGEVAEWVAEARTTARVVMFERPLMELTFGDLVKATSGFGRESQMAEGGRSGAAYRAVLPGEMHVVVRVLESARGMEEREAVAVFRDLARLRGPNILPLLGYCITGREKLLLYEYMERGDLHRWLHELPAGKPDVEDLSNDTWDLHHHGSGPTDRRAPGASDWPTRHRIALGVARGVAFLHQGWVGSTRPVVHGHLVPTNILLADDLEPRVADFASAALDGGGGAAEGDLYSYGVLLMELVTGREEWPEAAVEWARGLVRAGRGAEAVDLAVAVRPEWEREMGECLRVGYLCTAPVAEKRPTMQQVVGLLKDIRPATVAAGGGGGVNSSTSAQI